MFWRNGYNKVLGATLIIGMVNLIEFLPSNITIGGGVNGHTIEVQLFSFVVLLVFSYINRNKIKSVIADTIKEKPMTETGLAEQREKRIARFKLKYKDKSNAELTRILNSGLFDKDAVEAANRLLTEKTLADK